MLLPSMVFISFLINLLQPYFNERNRNVYFFLTLLCENHNQERFCTATNLEAVNHNRSLKSTIPRQLILTEDAIVTKLIY